MSWILEHLNIVIVGVLLLGSFLKSRFDTSKQDEQESEEFAEPDHHEQSRRHRPPLMPYVPPPVERTPPAGPAQRSPGPQPVFAATRSQSGAMTASADEAAAVLQNQRDIEERLRIIRAARPAKGNPKSQVQPKIHKPAAATPSIRGQLRNPAELRRAIVLREILDRPVGLR